MLSLKVRSKLTNPETYPEEGAEVAATLTPPSEQETEAPSAEEQLRQLRELLVGAQRDELRQEMARLEQRLTQEVNHLRDQIFQEIGALDRTVTNKLNALSEQLKTQQRQRHSSTEEFGKKLAEVRKALEGQLAQLAETGRQGQHELRNQVLSTSKLLSDALQQRHEEAVRHVDAGLKELRTEKTDRAALYSILIDVAKRLKSPEADSPAD